MSFLCHVSYLQLLLGFHLTGKIGEGDRTSPKKRERSTMRSSLFHSHLEAFDRVF